MLACLAEGGGEALVGVVLKIRRVRASKGLVKAWPCWRKSEKTEPAHVGS